MKSTTLVTVLQRLDQLLLATDQKRSEEEDIYIGTLVDSFRLHLISLSNIDETIILPLHNLHTWSLKSAHVSLADVESPLELLQITIW